MHESSSEGHPLPYKPQDKICQQIIETVASQEGDHHPLECEMVKASVYIALENMQYEHSDILRYMGETGDIWLTNKELHHLGHLLWVQAYLVGKANGIMTTVVQSAVLAEMIDSEDLSQSELDAVLEGTLDGERLEEIRVLVAEKVKSMFFDDEGGFSEITGPNPHPNGLI